MRNRRMEHIVKKGNGKLLHVLSVVLFIFYLVVISYFLFFSEKYGRTEGSDGYRYNLTLFQEIRRFMRYRHSIGLEGFVVNIFGNVLAFAPFGFCLPLVSQRDKKFLRILIWSFLFSFAIETIQLVYKIGIFDVDDLLLNTIGGVLGYILYKITSRIFYDRKGCREKEDNLS